MRVSNGTFSTGPLAGPPYFVNIVQIADQKADQLRTSSAISAIKTTTYNWSARWSGLVQRFHLVLVRSGGVSLDTPDGPPEPTGHFLNRIEGMVK